MVWDNNQVQEYFEQGENRCKIAMSSKKYAKINVNARQFTQSVQFRLLYMKLSKESKILIKRYRLLVL
ncbi:hypothetical protein D3X11_07795 [Streptococcus sp. X16XC17]|nr:hypothetical protein D3X11_07795 [Streptococcus sp. X16XC17]